ncbi:MAG: TAT-variant-translocated molybdopterin oxidoreductase [Acidobacteria bacterium]|nr:TAT-variant-translocated molybdopterin oxidoreductase [Acidobacteriota bacterium]
MTDRFDIEGLRARLSESRGREYWRSLESLAETPEFKEFLHREFPQNASEWLDPVGRRGFLKLMGASLALAGVSACTRQPNEELVPYVRQPEELVPGKPLFYATAMPMSGAGVGLLVESHEGRPTKIEGNPDHPASQGATDLFAQAAILGLYDPDRSQTITNLGEIRPFGAFAAAGQGVLSSQKATQGAGIRILTETVASPTLAAQIRNLLTQYPRAKWVQWEPVGRHNAREGSRLAFGEYVDAQYAVDKATVMLALDSDFLCTGASGLRHSRAFASRRRIEGDRARVNRLYAVESAATNTGTRADHRLSLRASQIESFARALAAQLGVAGVTGTAPEGAAAWMAPLVKDLQAHRGDSVVIAGDGQPPIVHALAHAINEALGNVGSTVTYTQTAEAQPTNQLAGLRELVGEMYAGTVEYLLILGGNPVYTAPADLNFAAALQRVPARAHLSLYEDETSALCQWHIPEAHFLEAWSDVRTDDGTATIIQPLIAPLYSGKSAHEVVAAIEGRERPGYELVREFWSRETGLSTQAPAPLPAAPVPLPATQPAAPAAAALAAPAPATPPPAGVIAAPPAAPPAPIVAAPVPQLSPFDREWRRWLNSGVVPNTAFPARTVTLAGGIVQAPAAAEVSGLEIVFRPDPSVYDGRFANNAWLQELPKALTKLTWDNAALVSPATAMRLSLISGDVVDLKQGERTVRTPVWIAPGQAPDTLTLHLGYGRTRAGRAANGIGVNVNPLRTTAALDTLTGVELTKTGETYALASTQDHWSLEGRNLIRVGTVAQFAADPQFAKKMELQPLGSLSLYGDFKYDGYKWGMAIDQNVCTGCNSCVVACQAENNIPVVGKSQVLNGREMHWLRIDRYYTGDIENPDTYHQPMLCQQCETAPCEVVCPVSATVHNSEGLNDMVYNRCVGTRYCSNNCPYKVRRFNFLLYQDWDTPSLKLQRNPDVTVRSRGVMEKCTYCVQRINQARVTSKLEDREIRDGEVVTACQSACPTEAIVFGNLNDPNSRVARLQASTLNYGLLAELNTRPRTTYMAVVRNPNTELEPATAGAAEEGA